MPFGAEGDDGNGNGSGTTPSGYGTEGDALPRVTQTKDYIDLNVIWAEMQRVLADWNAHRSAVVSLMSYWHTSSADPVSQGDSESTFERASEFGEPQALRPPSEYLLMGYDFEDYDRATRFTWKALRSMDARQVRAFHDEALNADEKLVTAVILNRLLNPEQGLSPEGVPVYGLWNGKDGMTPPRYRDKTFDPRHTHYLTTGSGTIDSADLEEAVKHLREHGRGLLDSNERIIALVAESESEVIQGFRANIENRNGVSARWDFIPATNAPPYIITDGGHLVGTPPPAEIHGLPSVGSYGPVSIVEQNVLPSGYFVVLSTAGPNSTSNAVGVRELKGYEGFRQVPGNQIGYPLQESFYTRGFGTGVRYRSAAVAFQLTESTEYTPPAVPYLPE
jgi:hypothetical protein